MYHQRHFRNKIETKPIQKFIMKNSTITQLAQLFLIKKRQVRLIISAAALSTTALLGLTSIQTLASPVPYQITLTATLGNRFGVSAPTTFTGTFSVDSTFLQSADGSYNGTNVTDFLIVMGTQ